MTRFIRLLLEEYIIRFNQCHRNVSLPPSIVDNRCARPATRPSTLNTFRIAKVRTKKQASTAAWADYLYGNFSSFDTNTTRITQNGGNPQREVLTLSSSPAYMSNGSTRLSYKTSRVPFPRTVVFDGWKYSAAAISEWEFC